MILHDDKYHIEKTVRRVLKKGRFHYEVKWVNYDDHTIELLVELFEMYGDSQVPYEITHYSENPVEREIKCGRKIEKDDKYVHISAKTKDGIDLLCLPAQSLQISEEAHLIPSPDISLNLGFIIELVGFCLWQSLVGSLLPWQKS